MRKIFFCLLACMLFLGSTMAYGASVSVMADLETGVVVPQALENRLNAGEYGTGNLIATNTPLPGQMLYAGGAGNSLLFWGEALATGATQIVANVEGSDPITGTYDPLTKTLTLLDIPAPESTGGDSSAWATNPAIANPNIGGFSLTNVGDVKGVDGSSLLQAGGATQIVANVQGQSSATSSYSPETKTLTLSDLPVGVSINGVYPVIVTNVGNSYYVGMVSLSGGTIIIPDVTNRTTFQYVSATNQFWNVPIGVTQVYAYVWGAGGGYTAMGGAGGFSYATIPTHGGETLTIEIGQAGETLASTGSYTVTRTSYPNGGYGVSRGTYISAGGGGRSSVRNGTNYIVVAGGGGGGASTLSAGSGGGLTGGDGTASASSDYGRGASQTNGGMAGSVAGVHQYVSTSGGFLSGGNGGCVTGAVTGAGCGGGDGWYGGGGGDVVFFSSARGTGGGGSGYVNPAFTTYGYTIRGVGTVPAMTEFPYYVSGAGTTENNGLIVLLY